MRKGKVANLPSPIQPVAVEFVQSSLPEGLGADLHTVKKLRSDDPEALELDRVTVGNREGTTATSIRVVSVTM